MLVLVVDSSTPAVTAALAEVTADRVVLRAERRTVDARAHGELLAPQIEAVLAEAGARPTDLAAIVAGLGPGPFTGLRVGLVTAATMGQVLAIPTYGVGSLDALGREAVLGAAAAPGQEAGTGRRVLVASDARRREIYWALFDAAGERVAGPAVDAPSAVAGRMAELGATVAVGEGAQRYADTLALPLLPEPTYPSPYALAELAAERIRAGAPGEPLVPLYLRRPDAVAATVHKSVLP
ncbi:tRNA threonylcarbamoyl adenosine modification protein YeaZ [Micromonospora pisi]|uniref:tRNA threonylcarbamoyl adenosine modification protein YeaZ n=1 Tax=Micromonospora pisi TaxID=589240 RepID=A0A495JMJ8_9ACTN|nr:tRNA (adenosine(37)-N6)-threonylcarbamoyltransferase complex dimerization subunit type 1 TsaB [Micromonospora pisi]RKR90143.1 tRNA threonylcarbamoyl adenosine modification protein YeaZ [Micromonospora pisi]